MTDTEVLVVGAGPTGLTLACALRLHGISVRVVDRAMHAPFDKAEDGTRFAIVNAMSNNEGMRWSLARGRKLLGYEPQDNVGEHIALDG